MSSFLAFLHHLAAFTMVAAAALPAIRRILHLELVGIVLILLFTALMADGIGYFG